MGIVNKIFSILFWKYKNKTNICIPIKEINIAGSHIKQYNNILKQPYLNDSEVRSA